MLPEIEAKAFHSGCESVISVSPGLVTIWTWILRIALGLVQLGDTPISANSHAFVLV